MYLPGYTGNVKLKFKAKMHSGPFGDIAIDDLRFYNLPATDLEMVSVTLPAPGCGLPANADVCTTIMNNGAVAQSMFPVSYQLNNGAAVTEMFTGTIAPGGTAQFCFNTKANLSQPGAYALQVSVQAAADADATNNTAQANTYHQATLSAFPYTENFENGAGGWIAGGSNSSWTLGTPAKPVINAAASGVNAWVTSLTGTHPAHEASYVMSPCFNFSALTGDPDLEMRVWWNAETHTDGAVLQTSIDGGLTWKNVGKFADQHNWYNDSTIYAQPGGQSSIYAQGWSGTGNNGSQGWITVRHKLDGMAGQASIKLRIAFAADSWQEYDGFAFDDVRIIDNTNNLAVTAFIPLPDNCGYGTNEKVEVTLENLGSLPVSNVSLQYRVNGGAPRTATFAGPLAGAAKTNFIFPVGADLSAAGLQQITIVANAPNDPDSSNDTLLYTLNNALYSTLPLHFDFETSGMGLNGMELRTKTRSAISDGAGASFGAGSTGLIMDGVADTSWTIPGGILNPWMENPENFAGAYFCVTPAGFKPTDSLWLEFDLKQLYKDAAANTNFRITVNGNQTGITYRPPFGGGPATWQHIKVPLNAFIGQGTLQIGLESSVMEAYANGTGTANLIDNVRVWGTPTTGRPEDISLQQVRVYPNPSSGIFHVALPPAAEPYALEVTDLSGKTLLKQTAAGNTTLQLPNVAPGLYLLKISNQQLFTTQKLLVK